VTQAGLNPLWRPAGACRATHLPHISMMTLKAAGRQAIPASSPARRSQTRLRRIAPLHNLRNQAAITGDGRETDRRANTQIHKQTNKPFIAITFARGPRTGSGSNRPVMPKKRHQALYSKPPSTAPASLVRKDSGAASREFGLPHLLLSPCPAASTAQVLGCPTETESALPPFSACPAQETERRRVLGLWKITG
jgi:hypothetical protein